LEEARQHCQAAYDIAKALANTERVAPLDAWMVEELETPLERTSAQAAR
jgi:hypothetical protein